jgi:tRNA pseudouridine13 synthase
LIEDCSYLLGKPETIAGFRGMPTDFVVDEVLSFEPDGEGEHLFVQIEKIGMNTGFVARHIAAACGVRERDVSYSGLKDRHAVATQWFSVHLPGKPDPRQADLETPGLRVITRRRHRRKLRRGTHSGNDFTITLRDVSGDNDQLESRLQAIAASGFPNYFGEQRFGRDGQNIERARALFSIVPKARKRDRNQGIYLSAARSILFNRVLSRRIAENRYDLISCGDVLMLEGSHSVFVVDQADDALQSRLRSGDVHITGPMWGGGKTITPAAQHEWEVSCMEGEQDLCDGLVAHKLRHERRALRARAKDLAWQWPDNSTLQVSFHLGNGSYATSMLRELVMLRTS